LEDVQAAHPGVPIDVIAHSQGGLVARSALGRRAPPAVRTLVTLATPHRGADVATFIGMAQGNPWGAFVGAMASDVRPLGIDPNSVAVRQMSESSGFLRHLDATPLPPGVQVTSVAARADPIVTSPKARLGGADNVVVALDDLDQHGGLPGSSGARREIALAVAGLHPSCESLGDALAEAVVGEVITAAEDVATGVALVAEFASPNHQPPVGAGASRRIRAAP
ncbi:MAG: lipase family alpha/beta hydrolase, partial [Acidimicrobiales bacterium]